MHFNLTIKLNCVTDHRELTVDKRKVGVKPSSTVWAQRPYSTIAG